MVAWFTNLSPQIQAAIIAAVVALSIELTPHVWRWIRRGRLDVEFGTRATVKQVLGRAGLQLHVVLVNVGGAPVKVTGMHLMVQRTGAGDAFKIPLHGYFPKAGDTYSVLFAPRRLKSDDEWTHHVNFIIAPPRDDVIEERDLGQKIRFDVAVKVAARDAAGGKDLVETEPTYWQPLVAQFHRNFKWKPGEYVATLHIEAGRASRARSMRFTIFESDAAELNTSDGYKYGWTDSTNPLRRGAVDVDVTAA